MGATNESAAASDVARLTLHEQAHAAAKARRFVRARLAAAGRGDLAADAELVVSELVTNAVLHVGPPVLVSVAVHPDGVRLEVADRSSRMPIPVRAGEDAMTGRGLSVVAALSRDWGVTPSGDGKVAWAELSRATGEARREEVGGGRGTVEELKATEGLDAAGLVDRWSDTFDLPARPASYHIDLGEAPTRLVLEAKAQVDNVVRELTLAAGGAASGSSHALPAHLAGLVDTVVSRFARPRQIIKRLAAAAAQQGQAHVRLVFDVTAAEVEAGPEYLAALDEVDAYAHAARLLTLETPPQHKVFRRWYVEALTSQVARLAAGLPAARLPSFEERLLDEVAEGTLARRRAERAARLHTVTAALARSTTVDAVARAVLSEAVPALGAAGGGLVIRPDGGGLRVPAVVGYPPGLVERLRSEDPAAELPAAVALRTGEPVWVESADERDKRFPELATLEPSALALCAVPLRVAADVGAALRFSFARPHLFDADERAFILALGAATAQALDRARLLREQASSAERLLVERARAEAAAASVLRLQELTAALVATTTVAEVVSTVASVGVSALGAAAGGVALVSPDRARLELAATRGYGQSLLAEYTDVPLDSPAPMARAVRSGEPVLLGDAEAFVAAYPGAPGPRDFQARAFLPLGPPHAPTGVLLAAFAEPRDFDPGERDLLIAVARQCGQALERAQAFAAEQDARARTSFLISASDLLTSSLDPPATLRHLCELIVPRLADWATVFLYGEPSSSADPTRPSTVAAAHRDPPVQVRLREAVSSGPLTGWLATLSGVHDAALLADLPEHECDLRTESGDPVGVHARSALAVPFVARGRRLGTLVLAREEVPGFTEEDLALVQDLAVRAAVAVDNAVQYAAQRDAALTLQRSLLPQRPPRLPGVRIAWRYLAGAAGAAVGGDWYDVLPLADGRLALCIGDVMGRGLQAAAIMGQLRATARAHATMHQGPGEVLAQLDAATARLEQEAITTCLYAVLDPRTGQLTAASAGHLAPLVAVPGRAPYYLPIEPGLPLGAGVTAVGDDQRSHPELTVTLPPASTLVLFTDGLVEDRTRPLDVGLHSLARAAGESVGDPEEFCDRALAVLGRDLRHADDTAMLVVTLSATRDAGAESSA